MTLKYHLQLKCKNLPNTLFKDSVDSPYSQDISYDVLFLRNISSKNDIIRLANTICTRSLE